MSIPTPRVVHLNRYYHFTELMRDPAIAAELLRYQSEHDGALQTTLVMKPAAQTPDKLFFFFHGMDGDSGDGVVVRNVAKHLNATVVTMGGRGAAWVSDAFLADAEQVIRTYSKDSSGFYLIGVSMGGTQALSLAGLLPDDLRRLVLGVIALIPGVNLPAILADSANERVRNTLRASVHGDESLLQQRSPTNVAAAYDPELPFVIFHNDEDTLLLTGELKTFIANLRRRGHKVATFSAPGDHNFTYEDFDYAEAIARLGTDAAEKAPPLTGAS
jgi:pimeloyl-ACP methyl ester carboxylesterase